METTTRTPSVARAATLPQRPREQIKEDFTPIGAGQPCVDPAALRSILECDASVVAITVWQYHHMLQAGTIIEGAPIELLEGMLVWKNGSARGGNPMTLGDRHIFAVGGLAELLPLLRAFNCHIRTQATLALSSTQEPEPDGAIVRGTRKDYADRRPGPADTSSVIEVADSSLAEDRNVKLGIYANAGIPQYMIINIPDRQIEIYEHPLAGHGRYEKTGIIKAGQNVSLLLPDGKRLEVPAAELLP
ncbi:MAG TPA: Uma2 family endonuclease [Planctomycetota bacterium]|jgi:Uma2 family endonuclease